METCLVYIDDIIVHSQDFESHLERLRAVFDKLVGANLHLKLKKCSFCQPELLFLGHIISAAGIRMDGEKIRALQDMPVPKKLDEVQRFLGMAGYYRKFINGFSVKAGPLLKLSKKNTRFYWSPECEKAYRDLIEALTTEPVLAYPNFSEPFTLYTDASKDGLGANLSQVQDGVERVIAYASRTTNKHEKNYSITELECLAVVWGTKVFRPYLHGSRFEIVTDHQALTWLHSLKEPVGRVGRWVLRMQEYDYTVRYRQGRVHSNVDPLSRAPLLAAAAQQEGGEELDIEQQQASDPFFGPIIQFLTAGELTEDPALRRRVAGVATHYGMIDKKLHFLGDGKSDADPLLCVPASQRKNILFLYHDDIMAGHLGVAKLFSKLKEKYWWPRMYADAYEWVRTCQECQAKKAPRTKAAGLLQPIPVLERWETIGVDVVGPLPKTKKGNRYILVFVEYMTKWPEAFAIPKADAVTVARVLFDEIICRYGAPRRLLSDRGKNFLASVVREVCELCGVKKIFTTAYRPQTDGLVERFNHTLVEMLAMYTSSEQDDWDEAIPAVLFAYRTEKHATTTESPSMLMFGREAVYPVETVLNTKPRTEEAGQIKARLKEATALARAAISKSQDAQKARYDQDHKDTVYKVGQYVLWFRPYRRKGRVAKLRCQWTGPFIIAKQKGPVNYVLRGLNGFLVKELVHVSKLKPVF
jgi:transposase InsO family protein